MSAAHGEAPGGLGWLATLFGALGVVLALVPVAPAGAVPPPPPRPDLRLDLVRDGPEQVVRDTVRAYQPVPVAVAAQAGERLLLRLTDRDRLLVLQIDAPSGLPWITGAQPGPDGVNGLPDFLSVVVRFPHPVESCCLRAASVRDRL